MHNKDSKHQHAKSIRNKSKKLFKNLETKFFAKNKIYFCAEQFCLEFSDIPLIQNSKMNILTYNRTDDQFIIQIHVI